VDVHLIVLKRNITYIDIYSNNAEHILIIILQKEDLYF
jgi:hypothetical protein